MRHDASAPRRGSLARRGADDGDRRRNGLLRRIRGGTSGPFDRLLPDCFGKRRKMARSPRRKDWNQYVSCETSHIMPGVLRGDRSSWPPPSPVTAYRSRHREAFHHGVHGEPRKRTERKDKPAARHWRGPVRFPPDFLNNLRVPPGFSVNSVAKPFASCPPHPRATGAARAGRTEYRRDWEETKLVRAKGHWHKVKQVLIGTRRHDERCFDKKLYIALAWAFHGQ